jgi:hypothetical protein
MVDYERSQRRARVVGQVIKPRGAKRHTESEHVPSFGVSVAGTLRALGSYQSPSAFLFDVHVHIAAFDRERPFAELSVHLGSSGYYRSVLTGAYPDLGCLDWPKR